MSDRTSALQASLDGRIPKGALTLFEYISGKSGGGLVPILLNEMQSDCRLSRPTVISYIKKLEAANLIAVSRHTAPHASEYRVLV